MSEHRTPSQLITFTNNSNVTLAAGIVLILAVMVLPLPSFIMDALLAMNLMSALVILFVSLYIFRPLEFSVFPGLLLIITLFRLSLNVATTRLILSRGYAGEIIETFGEFVVQGNYVVGAVIFIILVIINFVVITKGSTRIAEVSARFTLDAMPGKQMAIDADLNAGLIDDHEAQTRRSEIAREADFYGAMDGAAKFVRGDAIAGLLITLVNIVGGLTIGVMQRGLTMSDAAGIYMLLTIGDGLLAQIPALIISTAAGIIITRATSESSLGADITNQISNQPRAVMASAVILGAMGIIPGMPFIPFAIIGGILGAGAYAMEKSQKQEMLLDQPREEEAEPIPEEKIEELIHPDAFEIEIGYSLIPLVDAGQGGNLLNRITTIRRSLALELGVIIPPIRIRDNIQLRPNEYVFKIFGVEATRGEVMMNSYLLIHTGGGEEFDGVETIEPTFGLPAKWISEAVREQAELSGNTVVEPPAVIATHLMEVLKNQSFRFINRQETRHMLDHLKESHTAVVDGLVPEMVSLGVVSQILKNLLKEKIPIRNLVTILEAIADYVAFTKDPELLTEYVRSALAETITAYFSGNGQIMVATLDPRLEDAVADSVKTNSGQLKNLGLTPKQLNRLFESLAEKVEQIVSAGTKPIVLVSPQIRRHFRKLIAPVLPGLFILSYSELTPDTNLKSVGMVEMPSEI
ncbi:MAG TPA: flagellar biosynthesis protein FlhA [Candidatus Marinimicrobia bacterium]|nr:MAG: flagellar biosynthesis protein FlhA [Candidatus Marinimicrobia bacterium CG1_02_48_14]PIZ67289.1 MAG: flagellar biosynthesis protein FlhA [Candidatus Marinimicrobia bacterium CG_4_10_14_0_2_um_filter_48_9]HCW76579.1 flagellar biosynthesis protein FlhA [Candidatus Neomarinimicrobiota bacterium]